MEAVDNFTCANKRWNQSTVWWLDLAKVVWLENYVDFSAEQLKC